MNIVSVKKSNYVATPIVVILDDVEKHTDDEILDAALAAANETRGSLFGLYLDFYPSRDRAQVTMHRD